MARNGKKRVSSQTPSLEHSAARQRKIHDIKRAVASGSYSIHTEDIVLNVLREVLEPSA